MELEIFSTCSQSSQISKSEYYKNVIDVAQWSEKYGCKGILVYTDNSLVDPWLVSQVIIENTKALCPLVAIQPVYMHPYTAAKMVATYGYFYNRRIYLNMLAGGFKNDLLALNDPTEHDRRYDRMIEYTTIMQMLLSNSNGISFNGEFYKVDKLKMMPSLPPELYPGILVSGSSEAGLAAAKAIGATAVKYPKPPGEYEHESAQVNSGVRVGIIARSTSNEAWDIAHKRFPVDRKGEIAHQLAMKTSDSVWHKQLTELADSSMTVENNPYWLVPFQHYKTFCPYLVGDYNTVAKELARYVSLGFTTFILDIPPAEEELFHMDITFKTAIEEVSSSKFQVSNIS